MVQIATDPEASRRWAIVQAVRRGRSQQQVARDFDVSPATVNRWVRHAHGQRLDRVDWSRWLEAAGASGEGLLHGPILNHASMLIDAAVNGQGITLARTALVATDLINGRLVRPFQTTLPLKYGISVSAG